jgi:tetratricopeptide (TPR) repeat protein
MRISLLAASAVIALAAAGAAQASVTVIGGGMAEECSQAALHGRSDNTSIQNCSEALETEALNARDRAGTFINRGVMKLRRAQFDAARADFDSAIAQEPKLGEGWVNRGAAYVAQKLYREALSDINKGLALGIEEPEKAYYNRALAYEGLEDAKSAYLDYQQALAIKPDWVLPQQQLLRFTVTRR